jgi:hypothetical protein
MVGRKPETLLKRLKDGSGSVSEEWFTEAVVEISKLESGGEVRRLFR